MQRSSPTSKVNETNSSPASRVNQTQFIEQLKIFLNEKGKNISLKYDHNLDSTCCSGDIIAIQLVCKCQDDYNEDNIVENNSSALSVSYTVSILTLFLKKIKDKSTITFKC